MIQACNELRTSLLQSLQAVQKDLSKLKPLSEKTRARLERLGQERRSLQKAVASLQTEEAISGVDCSRKLATKQARLLQKKTAVEGLEEKSSALQKRVEALERDVYGLNMRSLAIFFMINSFKLVLHTPRCLLLCLGFNAEHAVSFFQVRLESLRQRLDRVRFSGVTRLRSRCPEVAASSGDMLRDDEADPGGGEAAPAEGAGSSVMSTWQYLSKELVRDLSFRRRGRSSGIAEDGYEDLSRELSVCKSHALLSRNWNSYLKFCRARRLEHLFSAFEYSSESVRAGSFPHVKDGDYCSSLSRDWMSKAWRFCGKNRLSSIYRPFC